MLVGWMLDDWGGTPPSDGYPVLMEIHRYETAVSKDLETDKQLKQLDPLSCYEGSLPLRVRKRSWFMARLMALG